MLLRLTHQMQVRKAISDIPLASPNSSTTKINIMSVVLTDCSDYDHYSHIFTIATDSIIRHFGSK